MSPQADRRRAELVQAVGSVALARAEYATARQRFEEARELFKAMHDARGEADCVRLLGELALAVNDSQSARSLYREAHDRYVAVGETASADECREKADIAGAQEKELSSKSWEQFFQENYSIIQAVVDIVAARHHLDPNQRDEFVSFVHERLIESDYAKLRGFTERSSFRTFISVVVSRLFLDYRNARWGKWRPSAQARRLGPVAEVLERLIARDGLSVEEAISLVTVNMSSEGESVSEKNLRKIAESLPQRERREFVAEEELLNLATNIDDPELDMQAAERSDRALEIRAALNALRASLPPEDALILAMRFEDGSTTAQISRALNVDQKHVYRRITKLLNLLRRGLQERGISFQDANDILEHSSYD